jgi:aminoglycoside phosphotransferase (APT) family kinase protein
VNARFPWLLLERLHGEDLRENIDSLPDDKLDAIARRVAEAQAATHRTPSAGRFGYAVRPADAPYERWSQVLEAHLDRTRERIVTGGYFDLAVVDPVVRYMTALQSELDQIPATPFLHDTTTKNVIVTRAGDFSGIVDVGDLCFGDRRYPAALTLAVLMVDIGRTDYVAAWQRHAGWTDDKLFRLYVALFQLDLMGEHGQIFNGNERPSEPRERAALLDALQATLADIERRP